MNVFTGCTQFYDVAETIGVKVESFSPSVVYKSGVTIAIWDTGWLVYNSVQYPEGTQQYFGSTGTYVLSGCVDCTSIRTSYEHPDQASWFILDCGTEC